MVAMSALVVMMLLLYLLLVAFSLTLWATLTLRGPGHLPDRAEAARRPRRTPKEDLPPVPAAFAAKKPVTTDGRPTAGRRDDGSGSEIRQTDGGSRSKIRATVRSGEDAASKKEREDAFERFRTAGDDIDF